MIVTEDYGELFTYRYRCEWVEGEKKRSDVFRADQLERVDN